MPSDNRQEAIDAITEKIMQGKQLTEKEVREVLFLARDHTLLYIARETVAGKVPQFDRMTLFSKLQNACDRHELMHPGDGKVLDESEKVRCIDLKLPFETEDVKDETVAES